jgi:hypothetical protein
MSTDDLVALGGVTLGGVAGLALTAALLTWVPKPPPASGVLPSPPVAPTPHRTAQPGVVDFAVIRVPAGVVGQELMVGPEGPHIDWGPSQGVIGR